MGFLTGGGGSTLVRKLAPSADVTEGPPRLDEDDESEGLHAMALADESTPAAPRPPRPLTRPAWAREANEADMLVGSEKPPSPSGLYSSPDGYRNGNEVEARLADDVGREVEVEGPLACLGIAEEGVLRSASLALLSLPSSKGPCRPWKPSPGKLKSGLARPMPARPPKGKNRGGVADDVGGDGEVTVAALPGSMKNLRPGKLPSMPLVKLRGFRAEVEGNPRFAAAPEEDDAPLRPDWCKLDKRDAAVLLPRLLSGGVTRSFRASGR